MAITMPVIPDPTQQTQTPTTPDQNQQTNRILKKRKKQIQEFEDEANEAIKRIEENLSKVFKFVCALRLDMVADQLDKINKKLASEIDFIANEIEKADWE